MSVIGRVPYIHLVLSKLDKDALSRLNLLVNDVDYENGIRIRLTNLLQDLAPYAEDGSHGVRYVQLTVGEFNARVYKGFLITYDNGKFGFFTFQEGVEPMQAFDLQLIDGQYKAVAMYQNLTAEEFRRALDDYLEKGAGGGSDAPTIIEVGDIYDLTDAQVESIKSGDIVVQTDGIDSYSYVCSEIVGEDSKHLIRVTSGNVIDVRYIYDTGSSQWVYDDEYITSLNNFSSIWNGSYAEDETLYTKDMKAGDIVVDTGFDFVGVIKSLEWDGDNVDEIVLVGLEDNDLSIPVTYVYDGSEWSRNAFSGGSSLPASTKAGQVLVSDSELEPAWADAAPLADNLLANPVNNDALYSSGPTGGLADISTGEESYLQEIKGYSIVWNQLLDGSGTPYQADGSHIYINYGNGSFTLFQNYSSNFGNNTSYKLFDLTLMFGGNDKIPFSLVSETEYPANGTMPAQTADAVQRFQRLFANVDLINAPYDAGTIKNVKATKLVETGRNLWDSSMETNGLLLLAGYRYEIYLNVNDYYIFTSTNNGSTWNGQALTKYVRSDGKSIWTFKATTNTLIKSHSAMPNSIVYVGFIHSGNYCLTAGTANTSYALTDVTIPAYQKHEFPISGIDGLNGLTDNTGKIVVYDTKDYRRVGSLDLSQHQSDIFWNDGVWSIPLSALPVDMDLVNNNEWPDNGFWLSNDRTGTTYPRSFIIEVWYDENDDVAGLNFDNDSDSIKPNGILLYPTAEPVATGEDAFEPIPLKSGSNWIVDDMGQEYFIQPSNTNCPVNQVSYYYENLKDKLQNLPEPIEVAAASYSYSNERLNGLKIGNTTYKLVPQGSVNTDYSMAIGYNTSANGSYNFALGRGAEASSGGSGYRMAIGDSSSVSANNSVAIGPTSSIRSSANGSISIGYNTDNAIQYSVTFDGTSAVYQRTWHCKSPLNVFFRNETNSSSKTTFAAYTSGHFLSEYIQLNTLMSVENIGGSDQSTESATWSNNALTSTRIFNGAEINGISVVVLIYDDTEGTWYQANGVLATRLAASRTTQILWSDPVSSDIEHIDFLMESDGRITLDFSSLSRLTSFKSFVVRYHLL